MNQTKPILKDVSFLNLMQKRIFNVLIIANPYDAFMLEDDGRVDEKIFSEYMKLGLRYPPSFTRVSTVEEADVALQRTLYDLIICMPGNADNDAFDVAHSVKRMYPNVPCVVLTPFSHGISRRMQDLDLSIFDYVFCWLGNTELILSIIKLIEDRMNVDNDTKAGVKCVLVVEDNIRFYSSILPNLYKYLLTQSLNFATEALNSQAEMLRMRGRPKVLLARNYEEAWELYSKYQDSMLGVISDRRYPREGREDPDAGLRLLANIRANDEYLPLMLETSEPDVEVETPGVRIVDKNSKKMNVDMRNIMAAHFGFGDFQFRDPKTKDVIMRIHNLKELQDNVFNIPKDSMLYHVSHNHISRWLAARAIFPVSEFLKGITWHKLQDVDAHRQIIFDAIVQYRHMKNIGVVAEFDKKRFDYYSHFARIGDGSLGGKGRGLAFLDNIILKHKEFQQFDNATVQIPKTVVLCTDIFDEFMDSNHLWEVALSDVNDEDILKAFLDAELPDKLKDDCSAFIDATHAPLAIRSSSLLEDSHYQPFAGIYSTYMIPYSDNRDVMLEMLAKAIKAVYASVYYKDSKAYMTATRNVIDQEKMAVILQEVIGQKYGKHFYPNISGVLRSLNFYPVGDEKAEEGIASLALGLGKYIVDGGQTLRVSPYHPAQVMQMSEVETALRQTQTSFFAIELPEDDDVIETTEFSVDDGFNIKRRMVKEADEDGSLNGIASTFDYYDNIIRPGLYEGGRKIISFNGVLEQGVFPLPELMQMSLKYGEGEMRRPVEIEMACNIHPDKTGELYLLQIRPIVDSKQMLDEDLLEINDDDCILRSHNSLGHGVVEGMYDVVYVKVGENFSPSKNTYVADEVNRINARFLKENIPYVLIGPGRWGSSDEWLGIPVKWPHISGAKLIVEEILPSYCVDPSQGTHFFQNLTSLGVGYFTIDVNHDKEGNPLKRGSDKKPEGYANSELEILNREYLDSLPAVFENDYIRHVRLPQPFTIKMDGMKQEGVLCKG
ncbi:MAG: phosphoenolpyruvate synthase [Prevotella sp.]|nr:phosphoenolpyruvate synthase [Candidatus Prevotella equi]